MDESTFTRELQEAGYAEITTVQRPANTGLDTHTHPFEARALILRGEIRIRCSGEAERLYRVGEVFHLARETPHTETYGPLGVSYVVGRK